jgi:hypothetical protein
VAPLSYLLPGRTARGIGVCFRQPSVKILALLSREFERVVFIGNSVPKLLDEL